MAAVDNWIKEYRQTGFRKCLSDSRKSNTSNDDYDTAVSSGTRGTSDRVTSSSSPQWRKVRSSMTLDTLESTYRTALKDVFTLRKKPYLTSSWLEGHESSTKNCEQRFAIIL
ncbi:hypothetical protein TNCV_5043411 [Trichonephila clavipes]|uniref:Uncharacterized protein n=1 Tax=Trichonephila clavipes TaxID=2585209 RepID=A0A8X6RCS7_TRICX|nr:hypothetical protein TNCV_5043411 [Trichonephila clavipes]